MYCVCAGSASTAGFVAVPLVCLRQITPVDDVVGIGANDRGNFVGLMTIYLTGPLIDNVLVPWQEGRIVTGHPAWWYLVGMLGASMAAWLLNWARLYVTSCVSERIASDLRTQTYAHLQQLSLGIFGGKRNGRFNVAHQHRHRPNLCVPLGQPGRFYQRYSDDYRYRWLVVVERSSPSCLHVDNISNHCLAGLRGAASIASRVRSIDVASAQLNSVLADTIPAFCCEGICPGASRD